MTKNMKFHSTSIIIVLLFICVSVRAEQLRIDHAIIAVHNLEEAVATYKEMGFTIKPGRLHNNGLINSHIKFSDKTELELMSVAKEPIDSISSTYSNFLQTGEGGAYIAFSGLKVRAIKAKLRKHNVEHKIIRGRLWDYVVFPEGSGIDHLFFIEKHKSFTNEEWVYKHDNSVKAIKRIWIEGGNNLAKLLKLFDAHPCANISPHNKSPETVYSIDDTELIVVPPQKQEARLRFIGMGFDNYYSMYKKHFPDKHGIFIEFSANLQCNKTSHNKANAADAKNIAAD